MINTLLGFLFLCIAIALLVDLKIDHWEWTDRQRKVLIVLDSIACIHFTNRSTAVWLLTLVAIAALALLIQTVKSYLAHRNSGGLFTTEQIAKKGGVFLLSVYTLINMIIRIIILS